MLKIGITGGIGSGKSTVTHIFTVLGIPVYDSDVRAKQLMHENDAVRTQLTSAFGPDIYTPSGTVDREHLASLVFNDPGQLALLNAIVHPAVGADFFDWCNRQTGVPYIVKEAALIFEAGLDQHLDRTVLIWAPEQMRIERVVQRDGVTEEQVRARMTNQWPDRDKVSRADFVIVNDGRHPLIRQVLEVHQLVLHATVARPVE